MTLIEFKCKYGYTFKQLSERIGKPVPTIQYWHDTGYTAIADKKKLLAVRKPQQNVWESKEYIEKSKQLGVNQ